MSHNQYNNEGKKKEHLDELLTKIERQLNWGAPQAWSSADFEKLSDLIFEKSKQKLSVTTLKRIWGRTSQSVNPTITTLDVLSKYAGANDWRDFKSNHIVEQSINPLPATATSTLPVQKIMYVFGAMMIAVIFFISAFNFLAPDIPKEVTSDFENVKLEIHKVTRGIPNTVVFKYDVRNIAADTIELQQSWDKRKRILLDPLDSLVTTTYFIPGYFNAKLVVDDQIIKDENLYLPSDGFDIMLFFRDEAIPRQLSSTHFSINEERMFFNPSFDSTFVGLQRESFLFVNLLEEPPIAADSFTFRMNFKMPPDEEADPCNPISLIITGQKDVYMLQMGHPGCSGKFDVYLGGDYVDGKHADLSYLGYSEGEWVDFSFTKNNEKFTFSAAGNTHTLSDSLSSIGKIGGVRFYTDQKIELRTLELSDRDQVVNLLK